jgi:hypothetical protein
VWTENTSECSARPILDLTISTSRRSIVLMAAADANYYFTAIDVGSYGREGDSYVFKKSLFWKRFTAGQLDLPGDKPLPSSDSR